MPTNIIRFPAGSSSAPVTALIKSGKKSTVRFAPHPPRMIDIGISQRQIDGARVTAANYRNLAAKADTQRQRERYEEKSVKWEQRAEELIAKKRGPQQTEGELFT